MAKSDDEKIRAYTVYISKADWDELDRHQAAGHPDAKPGKRISYFIRELAGRLREKRRQREGGSALAANSHGQ